MGDYGKIMGVLRPSLTEKVTDFFESKNKNSISGNDS